MVSLFSPILGDEEKAALCEVIDSNWVTMGDRVADFERAFARLHRMGNAVAVNSCTAALHLSLRALGIGPGDEVLVPALTFVATVNAILYVGASPVFVDIEDLIVPNISISDAEAKCSKHTKAVIVVHYGGYVTDMAAWQSFATAKGISLVEDAAHAPGVQGVGEKGDLAAFSFFSNKNMTTAEGGMVLGNNESALERIRLMRAHGMTASTLDRYRGASYSYDVVELGYNYRMDELRAAVGLVQLEHLPEWNEKRRRLTQVYRRLISGMLPEVRIPFQADDITSAHLLPALLPASAHREKIMSLLLEKGVQTSIHYPPAHRFSFYRRRFSEVRLPKTEAFSSRELTLPLHPSLEESDVEKVVGSLRDVIVKS